MQNKGFTIIELLAIIALLALLVLVSVPVYTTIRESIYSKLYDAKITELKRISEKYAEETGKSVFDVQTLIKDGVLKADNELGEYLDPRTNREMGCDVITVYYENDFYVANVIESTECYEADALDSLFGMVELYLTDKNNQELPINTWLKQDQVFVKFRIKPEYQNMQIQSIFWSGQEPVTCSSDFLQEECQVYGVSTHENGSKITDVRLQIKLQVSDDGPIFTNNVMTRVLLDIQKPFVVDGSIHVENDSATANKRRVEFELSDGSGSGVKEYAIVSSSNCYDAMYQSGSSGKNVEYLDDGEYAICVRDHVLNESTLDETSKFKVENVEHNGPKISSLSIHNKESYHSADVTLIINETSGKDHLKMCISKTGFLQDCTWEDFQNTKDLILDEDILNHTKKYDGQNYTIYVTVRDAIGNIDSASQSYTLYSECSSTDITYTDWNSCEAACQAGVQTRTQIVKDRYLENVTCGSVPETKQTVAFQTHQSVLGTGKWYQRLSLRLNFSDVNYCITSSEECIPNLFLNGTYSFETQANAQRMCAKPTNTSTVYSTCTCCSDAFFVDTTYPSTSFYLSTSSLGIYAKLNASDTGSGIKDVRFAIDDGPASSSATFDRTYDVADGVHTITAWVTDQAGHELKLTKSIYLAREKIYVSKDGSDETGDGSLENPFATLNEANRHVIDGSQIILLSDITFSGIFAQKTGKNIQLTYTSYGTDPYTIYGSIRNYDRLTIQNVNTSSSQGLVNYSFLTLLSGHIYAEDSPALNNQYTGTVYVRGGFLESNGGGALATYGTAYIYDGALLKSYMKGFSTLWNNGTLSIFGGTILSTGSHAISNDPDGKLFLQGNATVSTTKSGYSGLYNKGVALISSGSITASLGSSVFNDESSTMYVSGTANFSNNSYTSLENHGNLEVSGGTITTQEATALVNFTGSVCTLSGNPLIQNQSSSRYTIYNYSNVVFSKTSSVTVQNKANSSKTIYNQ